MFIHENLIYFSAFILTVAGLFYFYRKRLKVFEIKVKSLTDLNIITEVENERLGIYRKLIQESPNLFLVVDQSLQVIAANQAASQYKWEPSRDFENSIISDNCKLHFAMEINKVMKEGRQVHGEMHLTVNSSDDWSYFLYSIYPIRDQSNIVIGAALNAVDTTAQRKAEIRLQQQTEFIEGVLNAIPDPIYVQNEVGEWVYGNNAFSGVIDQDWPSYQGKSYEDVFPHETAQLVKSYDLEAFQSLRPIEIEESHQLREGHYITLLSKRTCISFIKGQRIVVAILRDISVRKKLESELQVSKARQYEASRLATLGETAGGIAHEINNPLNVIVGLAELMKATVEKKGQIEPEKMNEYCDRLVKYSMRIAKIIKGLRSISRDASQDPFAEVNLNTVVEETQEFCHQQFANRGIEMKIEMSKEPVIVSGRYAQVSQIVMNLFNNARDAVEGQQNATVSVQVIVEDNMGTIRIWDSGPGVPKSIEEKLMTPFFTTKPVGKGTGLGLSISRSIAQDHKGSLSLNREVADSCFELKIPRLASGNKTEAA